MRFFVPVLTFILLNTFTDFNSWSNTAICLWVYFLTNFLIKLNHSIAFREYILMMYGLNYLFSAAMTYEITQEFTIYNMRISPENYFSLTIPAMLCLYAGLYARQTKKIYLTQSIQILTQRLVCIKTSIINQKIISILPYHETSPSLMHLLSL